MSRRKPSAMSLGVAQRRPPGFTRVDYEKRIAAVEEQMFVVRRNAIQNLMLDEVTADTTIFEFDNSAPLVHIAVTGINKNRIQFARRGAWPTTQHRPGGHSQARLGCALEAKPPVLVPDKSRRLRDRRSLEIQRLALPLVIEIAGNSARRRRPRIEDPAARG